MMPLGDQVTYFLMSVGLLIVILTILLIPFLYPDE